MFLQFLLAAYSCTCDNLTELGCQQPATKCEEIAERFKPSQKQSEWMKRNLRVGFLLLAEIAKDF